MANNLSDDDAYRIIEELRKENRKLQAIQGVAVDVTQSDNDENNATMVKKNSEEFETKLRLFTTVKGKYTIKDAAVQEILKGHSERDTSLDKSRIGAALQAHILGILITTLNDRERIGLKDAKLEFDITAKTDELGLLLTQFSMSRANGDNIANSIPIKFRHLVFSQLKAHGFKTIGQFIDSIAKLILTEMDKYRSSPKSKDKLDKDARDLVERTISWFYQLKFHSVKQLRFYGSGRPYDPNMMDGTRIDGEENFGNTVVDICFFPLIAAQDEKVIFNKAKVFLRPKDDDNLEETKNDKVISLELSLSTPELQEENNKLKDELKKKDQELEDELKRKDQELEESAKEKNELEKGKNESEKKVQELEKEKNESEKKVQELEKEKNELEEKIERLNQQKEGSLSEKNKPKTKKWWAIFGCLVCRR